MVGARRDRQKKAQELIKAWYKSFLCRSFSTSLENSQYSLENCAPIRPTVAALSQFPYCRTFCGLWSAYWGCLINSLILKKKKTGDTGQRPQQNAHFRLRKVNHFTSASPFDILCESEVESIPQRADIWAKLKKKYSPNPREVVHVAAPHYNIFSTLLLYGGHSDSLVGKLPQCASSAPFTFLCVYEAQEPLAPCLNFVHKTLLLSHRN